MQPTVLMSEDGICSRLNGKVSKGPDTEDMATVAIRINTDTLQNIKVRIRGCLQYMLVYQENDLYDINISHWICE